MKRFALVLAVVLFGAACTDATAPTKSAMLVPTPPDLALQGNLPPPPADATIDVSVSSGAAALVSGAYLATVSSDLPTVQLSARFTGVYFANGASVEATAAAIELGDPSLSFLGTAWLRFDNNQTLGTSASANARFQTIQSQTTGEKLFGTGTLVIDDVTIRIDQVTMFTAFPDCNTGLCAHIEFNATATVEGIPVPVTGQADARPAFCRIECVVEAPPPA